VADIFVSYTSSDRDWANWVGLELEKLGHVARVHEWEISAGGNIPAWMEERHQQADHVLFVISKLYLTKNYSNWERLSAEWAAVSKRPNFGLPVFIEECETPTLLAPFKRCDLYGLNEEDAQARLAQYLTPARKPTTASFPGARTLVSAEQAKTIPFPGARFALSNIPISVPRHFLGREDALDAIDAALKRDEGRVAITALHGLRGVGKTTLAAAFAERHRADYRATWWIRAQTEATMRADLVALGVRLGWVSANEKEERALLAIRERARHESKDLLLIYDSAVDAASLRAYLPPGGGARVIVTSMAPAWRGVAVPIELHVWTKVVGANYLIARTGRDRERAEAETLSEALGGLPLAHEQAAAYCERLEKSLEEYRKRFEAAPAQLLDAEKDAPAEYHDGLTVAKTFALAIKEAAKLHPAAEPLIVHASLLAPEPIPLFLFSEGWEKVRPRWGLISLWRRLIGHAVSNAMLPTGKGLDEAVAALRAFALVDRETITDERDPAITTETIRLHRLVRAVAATRLQGEAVVGARRALIEAITAVYPIKVWDDPSSWPRARRLDALALDLVDKSDNPPRGAEGSASYLLDKLASYRQVALGAYSQAKQLFARALAIREQSLGLEHPDTARSFNNLAYLSQVQRDLPTARQLFERGLAIREKALGPEHPDTADSLNNLAYLLQEQGDYAGAQPLFERALAIREKVFGPEHRDTARSLNNLAYLLQVRDDFDGAQPLFERALAVREKALGPGQPDTATSVTNLGYLLKVKGDFPGARAFYERALKIHEEACGPEHPLTATSLIHLAELLQAQDDFAGAQPLFERALTIRMKALGSEHPETNLARGNLAKLRLAQGAPSEALALSEAALAVHDKVFGPNHDWTKYSAHAKADALDALGLEDEAATLRAKYGLDGSASA
jgi:tetratricopeptide (TPR) repeat protein